MKVLSAITKMLVLFALLFSVQSMTLPNAVEGVWAYEASGTPPEYAKGEIIIKKEEGTYKAILKIGQMSLDVDKVSVEGQKVDFSLYLEDSRISVTMNIDGDSFTGKASSYDGDFPLKGTRK